MSILFNVNEIHRNRIQEVSDSICIILECEGKDLEDAILYCISTNQIEADAELEITPASNVGTPLTNYI